MGLSANLVAAFLHLDTEQTHKFRRKKQWALMTGGGGREDTAQNVGGSRTCDPASVQFFVDPERHSALLDPKVFSRHGHVRTPSLRPHCGGPDAGVNLAPYRAGRLRFSLQKRKRERLVGAP